MTIHYITKAFELVSSTLAIRIMAESETGEAIKEKLKALLGEWGISSKVECATTDNAIKYIIDKCLII